MSDILTLHLVEILVSGFIKDFETKQVLCIVIPNVIYKLILDFYPELGFDKNRCGEGTEISGVCNETVTMVECCVSSVYHASWISSTLNGSIAFDLDVAQIESFGNLIVGFSTTDTVLDRGFAFNRHDISYAICLDGEPYSNGQRHGSILDYDALDTDKKSKVRFTLDLDNSNIKIRIDNTETICFENIAKGDDIKYKFAICFWVSSSGESISIINVDDLTKK